jgi:hypothetical protein
MWPPLCQAFHSLNRGLDQGEHKARHPAALFEAAAARGFVKLKPASVPARYALGRATRTGVEHELERFAAEERAQLVRFHEYEFVRGESGQSLVAMHWKPPIADPWLNIRLAPNMVP